MPFWENKHILLTGGAGFIGSHILDFLMDKGASVIVVDNLSSSTTKYLEPYYNNGNFKFVKGDILDFTLIDSLLSKDIDLVIHMAADPDVKESVSNPYHSFEINVRGTLNILEAMRKNDVSSIVFASSGGTLYGEVDRFPISEDSTLRPISPYGASKAACEVYLSAYSGAYGFKSVSLRYANIFGPRSNHGVMYDFFFKLKNNKSELEILGNGLQRKSYLYISDTVEASMLVIEHMSNGYDMYNIGSEEWITVNDIAKIIVDELGLSSVRFKYTGGVRGWPGDVSKILLDITKLKNLGWKQKATTEEGIRKYIRWLMKEYGWP